MANTTLGRNKPHSLLVSFFNANGLIDQIDEVREFVCSHQIDIFLVQETFLKPSGKSPRIANYHIVRNDRVRQRLGGTAIYFRRSLHCTPLDPPLLTNMEASVCQVSMTGHPSVILASVYLSPMKELLESDIRALMSLGDSVILAGDFNAKNTRWNCHTTNRSGRTLDSLAINRGLDFTIMTPDTPTRFGIRRNNRPEILDIALLKNVALQATPLRVLSELDSDHRPVLLQLGPPANADPPTKTIVDFQKLSDHLKSLDSEHLTQIPDTIESLDQAQAASLHLTNHIQDALRECSREIPNNFTRGQLSEEARELITNKNAKRREHDRRPTDRNRRKLWRAQKEVKLRIAELHDGKWDRRLSELSPSHVEYYKLARHLKSDPVSATPPLLRPNLPPAFEDIDKAECLADSLESQCSPSNTSLDRSHVELVDRELATLLSSATDGEPIPPTDSSEVRQIIKDFHAKKSPGPDNITNKTLKLLPEQIINLLVVIFNTLMAGCSFPDRWKEATVIGIPKTGKPRNLPSSYRPISLLNTLAKVYEKVILNRLKSVVESQKLLNDEQFGFRTKHSCVHQAHRLVEHIYSGFHRFQRTTCPTGVLFFDVAKAFDRVWHAGLLYKLFQLRVPGSLVRLLREYLTNRTFRYRLDGTLSSPRPIRAGVPQGSVLSPLLYALFTSDIPSSPHVSIAQFADDTALYSTNKNYKVVKARLQVAVSSLGDWFRKWRIEVNPEKSAAVLFERHKNHDANLNRQNCGKITLYGSQIRWQKNVKYLGVTFDKKLNFAAHLQRARNKALFVLGRLYPMICANSKMSLRHKITLYKTCIRPIMTYAGVVLGHLPHHSLRSIQRVQNKFMRCATGAPWFVRNVDLHRDLELPTIAQYLKQLSKSYFETASHHPNPLVVTASDYLPDRNDPPDKRRPKHVLTDPDDQITLDNAQYHTDLGTHTQRLRRRRRGPRFLTSPGRGFHPRARGRSD